MKALAVTSDTERFRAIGYFRQARVLLSSRYVPTVELPTTFALLKLRIALVQNCPSPALQ